MRASNLALAALLLSGSAYAARLETQVHLDRETPPEPPVDAEPPEPPATAPAPPPAAAPEGEEDGLLRRRRVQGEAPPVAEAPPEPVKRSWDPAAQATAFDRGGFRPDPVYAEGYDAAQQRVVYGGKHAIPTPRPLLELGYPLYSVGPVGTDHAWLGEKNLVRPQFLAYGDFRLAYGANHDAIDKSLFATRLNLDLDLKLTATERFHVLMRPLDHDGQFTRLEFKGPDGHNAESELNADPATAFFEGDLGQIAQGLTGRYNGVDLPVALGLVPLLFQNGVWLDDAFDGLALTLPARHSAALDISNMDFTFFAGWDEVTTGALKKPAGALDQHGGNVYGLASFIERKGWYYEVDYGYLQDTDGSAAFDRSYHNVSVAASKRFGAWLSHSTRVIHNFGQDRNPSGARTADGTVVLLENSLITRRPYTLVPYLNLFYGDNSPQSMARDAGAGGVLKNVGINFETDALTGFPKLADDGVESYGGALGLQYLFNLDRQIVLEVAGLDYHGSREALGQEYAVGLRFQQPFARQWIFRTDAIVGDRDASGGFWGVRAEIRVKF